MSTKDHTPLPLGQKIPHGLPRPARLHLLLLPHALQRIAQGPLGLEIGTDLLSAEAFRMLTEQCENQGSGQTRVILHAKL
jgi:hypothetical protein